MKLINIKKIIIGLILLFSPSFVGALSLETDISVQITPFFPKADQEVSLSIESYTTDLDRADISWYQEGVLKKRGLGEKEFSLRTGDLGQVHNILVEIASQNQGLFTKEIQIKPAEVDLVWEADTYTPPFYKGKSLNSIESDVKFVAIPSLVTETGEKIRSEDLVYKWKKNWSVLGSKSGAGRNELLLKGSDLLTNPVIAVEVESLDGSLQARDFLSLKYREQKVVFYKKDPLLGTLFNKAVSNQYNMNEEEVSLVAYPFFFSKKDHSDGSLMFNWLMNNEKIDNNDNIIVLRQEGDDEGSSNIRLSVKNTIKDMQIVNKSFDVIFGGINNPIFGGNSEGSIFGN